MKDELQTQTETLETKKDYCLTQISPDLARHEAAHLDNGECYIFHEEINFRNDSGYNLQAMLGRAKSVVERAFHADGSTSEPL
jgi:hypothetical protein